MNQCAHRISKEGREVVWSDLSEVIKDLITTCNANCQNQTQTFSFCPNSCLQTERERERPEDMWWGDGNRNMCVCGEKGLKSVKEEKVNKSPGQDISDHCSSIP